MTSSLTPTLAVIGAGPKAIAVAAKAADRYVRDNPWTAIGVAAGVGVLVGVLIARR